MNNVNDRDQRTQSVAPACLKVDDVNTGEVQEEDNIMTGKRFRSPNSTGIVTCETGSA